MPEIQTQPYNRAAAISTSNTVDLERVSDAIVVGVAGNIAAVFPDDRVVIIAMAAGIPLPIAVKRINATSTTATGLTALNVI
jgi:hypothetical protein